MSRETSQPIVAEPAVGSGEPPGRLDVPAGRTPAARGRLEPTGETGSLGAGASPFAAPPRLGGGGSVGTYRAAILDRPGHARLETLRLPEPGARQVRIRLEGCGVCGSNLAVWEGRPWFKYPLAPGEPGHEGWGRVDAVGAEVTGVRAGDRVAALSYHGFAEYDLAEAANVVKLPPELDGQPFPGEALGCAMNVFQRADIRAGQNVAIVGIGFLGALLTNLVARAGARAIAVSRRPEARDIARRMGASETVAIEDPRRTIDAVRTLTGGDGCERVIEVTGFQAPLDIASGLTKIRGKLIVAGYHQDGPRQVDMQLWNWRGLDVINAHERDPRVYVEGMRAAVAAVAARRLDPTPLYTHRFRLDQLGEALDCLRRRDGAFLKGLVMHG